MPDVVYKDEQDNLKGLSSQAMGTFIPFLVKKLADSKNIIRQETIRALIRFFDLMRLGLKNQNNFISLVLPFLNNSSNWHIREELLNVLILCFLKSSDYYEFDSVKVIESIISMLQDPKDRIRMIAMETLVAYCSIDKDMNSKKIMY